MDIRRTLGIHRRGSGDPAYRVSPGGSIIRGSYTPDGPGVLAISRADKTVVGRAYGDGAEWLLDRLPRLLGADDEPEALTPKHDTVARLVHGGTGVRLGATDRVWEALVPAVLEQKVPGAEAWRAWRYLINNVGIDLGGAKTPPPQRQWLDIPSWEWHKSGAEPVRMRTIRAAATIDVETKPEHLTAVHGIGPWTEAEIRIRALGATPMPCPSATITSPHRWASPSPARKPMTPACSNSWNPMPGNAIASFGSSNWSPRSPPGVDHGCPCATTATSKIRQAVRSICG